MKLLAPIVLALAAGCGSSEPATSRPATSGAPAPGAQPAAAHEEEHHRLTPELQAFHDQLAPRWHASKGEARTKDTCGALADFKARAADVKAASAPAAVEPASWQRAGTELVEAVNGLATACGGKDPAAFDAAFEAVHTSFHRAMELVAGEHDMRGEHGDEHEGRGEHEGGAGHGRNEDGH
jgi:hypothetical protein